MPVSASYKAFVLEQLSAVAPVSSRAMFGGVGIYAGSLFFAILDDDRLYFKVDDTTRPRFAAAGMGPFDPFKNGEQVMDGYYEVPGEVLEDEEQLPSWMNGALSVAARSKAGKQPKKRAKR